MPRGRRKIEVEEVIREEEKDEKTVRRRPRKTAPTTPKIKKINEKFYSPVEPCPICGDKTRINLLGNVCCPHSYPDCPKLKSE